MRAGLIIQPVGRFARETVRQVVRDFGLTTARRAVPLDPTEEVFLLSAAEFTAVDSEALTRALMDALPHTKVAVIEEHPRWETEAI